MAFGLLEKIAGRTSGVITIYGEAGTGKTNICLASADEAAKEGKKVVYVDPQNNFSTERLGQIEKDYRKILQRILIIRPRDFDEQTRVLDRLRRNLDRSIGLVVIDPISVMYRLEFAKRPGNTYLIGRDLGVQLSYLNDISRKNSIPVIVTAQTHADIETGQDASMVGGDVIDYMSSAVIELRRRPNMRVAVLKKPKGRRRETPFSIENDGIRILE
jgi:DNA repair protein RadB